MPTIRTALHYAENLGWAIFPVGPDCRTPLIARGCHAASSSPHEIREMFAGRVDVNLALATGQRSGVFALDIDCKGEDGFASLAALEARHGPLPTTWRQSTPSGGAHLLFKQPARKLRNRVGFAPGLDCRTDGGSIALAPSRKPTGAYRWVVPPEPCERPPEAPAWLLDLIDPPQPERPHVPPVRLNTADRAVRYVVTAIDSECRYVAGLTVGGRNLALFKAAANLSGLCAGLGIDLSATIEKALERAAHDCGLMTEDGAHQVRLTIASGMRAGLQNPREVSLT